MEVRAKLLMAPQADTPRVQGRWAILERALGSRRPRFSGSGSAVENGYQHHQTFTGLDANAWTISDEDGTWVGTGNHFSSPDGGRDFVVCDGRGGYEGLSAYVAIGEDVWTGTSDETRSFEGVIFPGELPVRPDPLPLE